MRLIIFFLLLQFAGIGQVSGDLQKYIEDYIATLPSAGSELYADPSSTELTTWENALTAFFNGDFSAASDSLNILDYNLVYFEDTITNSFHHLIEKKSSGNNHWGTYIFNESPCRSNVIIQSPHPIADTNTGKQGIYVYLNSQTFAFMISGTHRCGSSVVSGCTGTTSSCGSSMPYTISDMAHNVTSVYFLTTELLGVFIGDPYFLQLHGFSKRDTDPYLIFSNSSGDTPPNTDLLLQLAEELVNIDPVLDFKIPHIHTSWTRLVGFWNVQGRLLNGSINPCTENSPYNSGRFFHLEQERTRMRLTETEWDKMAQAVNITFDSIYIDKDTLRQNFVSAPDTLELRFLELTSNVPKTFQAGEHILIHPNTCLPVQEIEIRIK